MSFFKKLVFSGFVSVSLGNSPQAFFMYDCQKEVGEQKFLQKDLFPRDCPQIRDPHRSIAKKQSEEERQGTK